MSLTVYLFDTTTKEFAGTWECQESPLEPEVYIQPTESTTIEPISFDVTQTCTWNGSAWVIATKPVEPVSPVEPEAPLTDIQKLALIRTERDRRLASSDWTQLSDTPVNKEVWATYRQELRDFPDSPNLNLDALVWPTPPSA